MINFELFYVDFWSFSLVIFLNCNANEIEKNKIIDAMFLDFNAAPKCIFH